MQSKAQTILEVIDLFKWFPGPSPGLRVHAVNGVSFSVQAGEIVGVVGESGCGKSTIARLVAHLSPPSSGQIRIDDIDVAHEPESRFRKRRSDIQIVFQDPIATLNPRHSVARLIEEPLILHTDLNGPARANRVRELAELVKLSTAQLERSPAQLSGGQLQRVSIARAIATHPRLIILDEPTSSLDLTIRASILGLLSDLRRDLGVAMLLISHDLASVRHFTDRVIVIYLGRIVEIGRAQEILQNPAHPYTRFLLSAELLPDPLAIVNPEPAIGEMPSPMFLPNGCGFSGRCIHATDVCRQVPPEMHKVADDHEAACFLLKKG